MITLDLFNGRNVVGGNCNARSRKNHEPVFLQQSHILNSRIIHWLKPKKDIQLKSTAHVRPKLNVSRKQGDLSEQKPKSN